MPNREPAKLDDISNKLSMIIGLLERQNELIYKFDEMVNQQFDSLER